MHKKIELHQNSIEYTLRRSARARRMRLTIHCDGNFVVTVPPGMSEGVAERFIREKSRWIIDKLDQFKRFPQRAFPKVTRREYLSRKEEARTLVGERIGYFNAFYGFTYNNVTIRNQKTRWGSCSRRGNLNFNYKIMTLPARLRDLIIVHELCHLKEFNHSRKFWDLVERAIPDYKNLRRELKRGGM